MKLVAKHPIGSLGILSDSDETIYDDFEHRASLLSDDNEERPSLRDSKLRWYALLLTCISFGGTFYAGNVFIVLQTVIMKELNMTLTQYNTVRSISQIPGLILPFVSGILVDRVGLRPCFVMGSVVDFAGYVIIAIGIHSEEYGVIVLGSCLTTMGDNMIYLCRNTMTVKWFAGKELSFALGIGLGYGRLFNSGGSLFSPMILDGTGSLSVPFWVGVGVCLISFLATIGLAYIDKKTDREEMGEKTDECKEKHGRITLRDFREFGWVYVLLALSIGLTYAAVFGFVNNANDMISKRFGFSIVESGRLLIIIYMCPVVLSPFVGFVMDKYGKRVLIVLVANIFFVVTQISIALLPDRSPEHKDHTIAACLLVIGLYYSIFAGTMWGCIPLTVPQRLTGLAYGMVYCWSNLLAVIYPLVFGHIHDHTTYKAGYFWVQVAISIISMITLLNIVGLYIVDRRTGGRLNKPGSDRKLSVKEKVYSCVLD